MTMKSGTFFRKIGLLTAALTFAGTVFAGTEPAPPSQPFRLAQPSMKGTLIFLPAASCGGVPAGCVAAHLIFAGTCRKEPVQVSVLEFPMGDFLDVGEDILDVTAAGLDGRYLQGLFSLIGGQNPNLLGNCDTDADMAIVSVSDFVNRNGFINASTTLKFAPPR